MATVYDKLAAIAADKAPLGYLRAYANDLHVIDRDTLATAPEGARFVWALRPCGTALFPIGVGHDMVWLTYWLDSGNIPATPTLTYLVEVTSDGGKVQAISHALARKLSAIPHPVGWRFVVSLNGSHYVTREGARV